MLVEWLFKNYNSESMRWSLTALCLLLAAVQALAQQSIPAEPKPLPANTPMGTVPNADSPLVLRSFFFFHDDFSKWMDVRKAKDSTAAQRLDPIAAKLFRISQAELRTVALVSSAVVRDLADISKKRQSYLDKTARDEQYPDPAKLADFAAQETRAINDAVDKLNKQLSVGSWAGLHSYINEVYRQRIRTVTLGAKK